MGYNQIRKLSKLQLLILKAFLFSSQNQKFQTNIFKLHYNIATLMINLENLISRRCILCISKKRQSYHRRTVVPWPALNVSFSSLWGLQGSKEWTSDLAILTSFTKIFCSMFFKICSINRYLISEKCGDKLISFFATGSLPCVDKWSLSGF